MPHTERTVCMCETLVHVPTTHLVQLCTALYRHCAMYNSMPHITLNGRHACVKQSRLLYNLAICCCKLRNT